MSKRHGFDMELHYEEETIRVTGYITDYVPATGPSMESAGGDPPEGGEIEDFQAFREDGSEIEDADGKIPAAVEETIMEQASEDAAGDESDAAEARSDARRENV